MTKKGPEVTSGPFFYSAAVSVLLWLANAGTMVTFYRVSPLASGLLAPYLLWVSFATVINFEIFRLN